MVEWYGRVALDCSFGYGDYLACVVVMRGWRSVMGESWLWSLSLVWTLVGDSALYARNNAIAKPNEDGKHKADDHDKVVEKNS